jgi:toxin FitB
MRITWKLARYSKEAGASEIYCGLAWMTVDCLANKRQLPRSKTKTFVKRLSRVFTPRARPNSLFGFGLTVSRPIKRKGKKRERLEAWFAGQEGPQSLFKRRILPFDEKAALVWARLMSEGRAAGKPRSDLDMIVAAIAETNECVIVTDNEALFGPRCPQPIANITVNP